MTVVTDAHAQKAQTLNEIIDDASEDRVRATFKAVCQELPAALEYISSELLVAMDSVPGPNNDKHSSEAGKSDDEKKPMTQPSKGSTKRIRSRYAWCDNCHTEFDVLANTSLSCRYHIDEPELVSDQECDVDKFGNWDVDDMLEDMPEFVIYECCGRHGDEPPCTTGWHREREPVKKTKSS